MKRTLNLGSLGLALVLISACGGTYRPNYVQELNASQQRSAGTASSCSANGQIYQIGQSVPSLDNCNTCSCGSDGQIACTMMFCLPQK